MIGAILNFVTQQMDAVIRQRLRLQPSDQKVFLTPIVGLDGAIAVKSENVLVFSLVSIQKDPIANNVFPKKPDITPESVVKTPPLHLNLYMLLGAYYKPEQIADGLDVLTIAMSYLQGKPLWTAQNSPGLPSSLERLIFEMESCDFHQLSHIWGTIGAKYIPSVLYKTRMVVVDDEAIIQLTPIIHATDTEIRKSN